MCERISSLFSKQLAATIQTQTHPQVCTHTHTHPITYPPTHLPTHSPTHPPRHSHTLSPSHTHTHTHAHTLSLSLSLCLSHTHTHMHALPHSPSLTRPHAQINLRIYVDVYVCVRPIHVRLTRSSACGSLDERRRRREACSGSKCRHSGERKQHSCCTPHFCRCAYIYVYRCDAAGGAHVTKMGINFSANLHLNLTIRHCGSLKGIPRCATTAVGVPHTTSTHHTHPSTRHLKRGPCRNVCVIGTNPL